MVGKVFLVGDLKREFLPIPCNRSFSQLSGAGCLIGGRINHQKVTNPISEEESSKVLLIRTKERTTGSGFARHSLRRQSIFILCVDKVYLFTFNSCKIILL